MEGLLSAGSISLVRRAWRLKESNVSFCGSGGYRFNPGWSPNESRTLVTRSLRSWEVTGGLLRAGSGRPDSPRAQRLGIRGLIERKVYAS